MLPMVFMPCSPCLPWRFPQETLVSAQHLSLPILWALLSSSVQALISSSAPEGYLPGLPFRCNVRSELELPLQKCQALRGPPQATAVFLHTEELFLPCTPYPFLADKLASVV